MNKLTLPILGYTLKMHNMDAKRCEAVVKAVDQDGPILLDKKSGYLVDMVNYLEEMGVDRYEMVDALESMQVNGHNTAIFGTLGTLKMTIKDSNVN